MPILYRVFIGVFLAINVLACFQRGGVIGGILAAVGISLLVLVYALVSRRKSVRSGNGQTLSKESGFPKWFLPFFVLLGIAVMSRELYFTRFLNGALVALAFSLALLVLHLIDRSKQR